MAADVQITPAGPADIDELAAALRPADAAEIAAYGLADAREALHASLRASTLAWAARVDGHLAAVLGLAPLSMMSDTGAPWMMGTALLDKHSRILVRLTPQYIRRMRSHTPHLVNVVHAENATSVRWLQRLGFTLGPIFPLGTTGALFRKFEMKD